jgi:hypothetical protein
MAERQYQIPGGPFVNETDERQYQIPGGPYINETAGAAPSGAPTLSDLQATNITSSSVQFTYDYAF